MKQPNWVVLEAIPKGDYTIDLLFADGQRRVYDATSLLDEPYFSPLSSLPFFLTASVECGTVVWGDELDIAPETLYRESSAL